MWQSPSGLSQGWNFREKLWFSAMKIFRRVKGTQMWDELPWEAVAPRVLEVLGGNQGFSLFTVHRNHLRILSEDRFNFRSSEVGPENLYL